MEEQLNVPTCYTQTWHEKSDAEPNWHHTVIIQALYQALNAQKLVTNT